MEPYRVFISSIMNRSIEDLLGEREAVRSAVEHFAPITTPWDFEAEPASYFPHNGTARQFHPKIDSRASSDNRAEGPPPEPDLPSTFLR